MRKLIFYGASDDLVEVEGDDRHNEINCWQSNVHFEIAGIHIELEYTDKGTWGIKTYQINEDIPVTVYSSALYYADKVPYSAQLEIWVPEDAILERVEA